MAFGKSWTMNTKVSLKEYKDKGRYPIRGATFFFVCRCWGVTPHIYSISRSLLIMFLITGAKVLHFSYTTKNHLAELCEIPLTFLPYCVKENNSL